MTQIINFNIEEPKQFEYSTHKFSVDTDDYDYCYDLEVVVEEKLEICNYNNPERECETIETWKCNGTPVLKAIYNRELEGPCQPDEVEILNAKELHKILITCGSLANLFNKKIIM